MVYFIALQSSHYSRVPSKQVPSHLWCMCNQLVHLRWIYFLLAHEPFTQKPGKSSLK